MVPTKGRELIAGEKTEKFRAQRPSPCGRGKMLTANSLRREFERKVNRNNALISEVGRRWHSARGEVDRGKILESALRWELYSLKGGSFPNKKKKEHATGKRGLIRGCRSGKKV